MPVKGRVTFEDVTGAEKVFTDDFLRFVVAAHDKFGNRINEIRTVIE